MFCIVVCVCVCHHWAVQWQKAYISITSFSLSCVNSFEISVNGHYDPHRGLQTLGRIWFWCFDRKSWMDLSLLRHFGRADGLREPFEFVCSSVKVSRSSSVSCLCRLGGGKKTCLTVWQFLTIQTLRIFGITVIICDLAVLVVCPGIIPIDSPFCVSLQGAQAHKLEGQVELSWLSWCEWNCEWS